MISLEQPLARRVMYYCPTGGVSENGRVSQSESGGGEREEPELRKYVLYSALVMMMFTCSPNVHYCALLTNATFFYP